MGNGTPIERSSILCPAFLEPFVTVELAEKRHIDDLLTAAAEYSTALNILRKLEKCGRAPHAQTRALSYRASFGAFPVHSPSFKENRSHLQDSFPNSVSSMVTFVL